MRTNYKSLTKFKIEGIGIRIKWKRKIW
jgi:hypothetical protein